MKSYARHASVCWRGTRQRGKGAINTPSAALKMALHAADGDAKREGTNPAVRAAAHAVGKLPFVIAKIERSDALTHFDEILTREALSTCGCQKSNFS